MSRINHKIIVPILIFLILTLPFIKVLPYLDGNIDFAQTLDFYIGGIDQYFANWNTVHPPLKIALIYPAFLAFGPSPSIYNLFGIIFGIIGIISIYLLTKKLANEKTAFLAAVLLSIYPLFIANSIFVMRDLMLTSLILLSLYFYTTKRYIFYAISVSLTVLTKETGLLLPVIIIFTEIIYLSIKKDKINKDLFIKIFSILTPILIYYLWKIYLTSHGKNSWSEWIFTNNENKSAIYTILNNLITFNFLNPYAQAHLKQLIFLNFNWIYILIFLGTFIFIFLRKGLKFNLHSENSKVVFVIILFVSIYILSVLTLQTYTIPRYALPIIPFIIIGVSTAITRIRNESYMLLASSLVIGLMLISLFSSIDPIANLIWEKTNIFNNKIYALNEHMAGNDGITYNLQYLLIAKERSELIENSLNPNGINSEYCRWIFPDPNNETKMMNALKINVNISCNQK